MYLLLLLFCTTAQAQIQVAKAGDDWHVKIDSALTVIRTYDLEKYELLQRYCKRIDYWTGTFATTENKHNILIPASEIRLGIVNDLAAILVHESLHLYYLNNNIRMSVYEEESKCYLYELDFLYCIPNVEPWLLTHALTQAVIFSRK